MLTSIDYSLSCPEQVRAEAEAMHDEARLEGSNLSLSFFFDAAFEAVQRGYEAMNEAASAGASREEYLCSFE